MTPLLRELLQTAAQGLENLTALIRQRSNQLTPQVADEAKAFFNDSLQAGEGLDARLGALVASFVYTAVGEREKGLSCYLDVTQTFFMQAETPEAYQGARGNALSVIEKADEIGSRQIAFRAAVLAADCSFFAAQASPSQAADEFLLATLEDVAEAGRRSAGVDRDGWFSRLVSLLSGAVLAAQQVFWPEEDRKKVDRLLARLAAFADAEVPVDFEFPGDPAKTQQVAEALALLSAQYGADR